MLKSLLSNSRKVAGLPIILQSRHYNLDPTEVRIPVPWGHVAGKWWNGPNAGSEPILALHGWLDNSATFDRLIPLLSPTLSILAVDLPGHGMSSHFPKGMTYEVTRSVMTVKRITEFYGWKQVSLLGHSLGGAVSFVYSSLYNDHVEKLVLLDILTPVPRDNNLVSLGGKKIDSFLKNDSLNIDTAPLYTLDDLTKALVKSHNGGLTDDNAKILLQRGATRCENGLFRLSRDVRLNVSPSGGFPWSENEVRELCRNIRSDILCLKADSSSYYFKKEVFYSLWDLIVKSTDRQATLKLVPGKHHVHLQDPENVASQVNSFLLRK